ncbi:uncharacterized protein LOC135075984 [Ostrinia nubilalis]|uniref:uncharacterized protein LOC135075984 n=1 Tax=Ostrinia nubilalis TaxID=29057 RepID=UPI0030825929
MTLRRCDSLPTHLRDAPAPAPDPQPRLPDSTTVPDFAEPPDRDQVIATWKSLHTDVTKIKNGFPPKNGPNHAADKKPITHNFAPAFTCNNRRITYDNRQVGAAQEVDRSSSYPLDTGQTTATVESTSLVRRRTLLERLLSWKKRDCDCKDRYKPRYRPAPKLRAEDLLCTCGVSGNRIRLPECKKYAERGRSKSVGYEAAREVTQFRRCASAGASVGAETAAALRARAALTLARRYYPEGGWGWTITVVGTIVQVLSHGLQLGGGTGAIACTAAVKYRVPPLYTHAAHGQILLHHPELSHYLIPRDYSEQIPVSNRIRLRYSGSDLTIEKTACS